MTQCERVLKYMEDFGSITNRDAVIDLGIMALPRRICDLEELGHRISRKTEYGKNRYGERVHFTRYRLEKE